MKYILFSFSLLMTTIAFAQCEVLQKRIETSYEGECKKGKAHGEGSAKGLDTYVGEFSKGYPNGTGIYTWASGAIFEGEFKKGKKQGKGKLQEKGESNIVGYWDNDEYIGTEKNPYKVIRKTRFVGNVRFTRKEGNSQIIVSVIKSGRVQNVSPQIISMEGSNGNIQSNPQRTTIQSVDYPYTGKLTFSIDGENHELQFRISHEGNWDLKIPVQQ